MEHKSNWIVVGLTSLLSFVLLPGCGAGDNDSKPPAGADSAPSAAESNKPHEPVTLTVRAHGVVITDEVFRTLFEQPVQRKYPYITLSLDKSGIAIDKLVAAGSTPDLFILNTRSFSAFGNLKITEDLNDLVQKHSFDLNKFQDNAMRTILTLGDGKQLFGIPFYQNLYALYYNKEIFNKFGVSYPLNGMTWDETIELGKKLTRLEGGVQYQGLSPSVGGPNIRDFVSGFALPYIDPKTMKATVNTDGWKKALTILKEINEIPGNYGGNYQTFVKNKDLAMMVSANPRLNELEEAAQKGVGVDYDLATAPYFPELPGKTQETDIRILSMSSTTKHKEEVFQAIEAIVAPDNLAQFVRKGFPPVLKDDKLKELFGAELTSLQGKHKEAFFQSMPILSPVRTKYVNDADRIVQAQFNRMLKGEVDVNTALREAEEQINQLVAAGER